MFQIGLWFVVLLYCLLVHVSHVRAELIPRDEVLRGIQHAGLQLSEGAARSDVLADLKWTEQIPAGEHQPAAERLIGDLKWSIRLAELLPDIPDVVRLRPELYLLQSRVGPHLLNTRSLDSLRATHAADAAMLALTHDASDIP